MVLIKFSKLYVIGNVKHNSALDRINHDVKTRQLPAQNQRKFSKLHQNVFARRITCTTWGFELRFVMELFPVRNVFGLNFLWGELPIYERSPLTKQVVQTEGNLMILDRPLIKQKCQNSPARVFVECAYSNFCGSTCEMSCKFSTKDLLRVDVHNVIEREESHGTGVLILNPPPLKVRIREFEDQGFYF